MARKKPWYGRSDAEIELHAYQFEQGANLFGSSVPLTGAEVTSVENAYLALVGATENLAGSELIYKAALEGKNQARDAMVDLLQRFGTRVRASPFITDDMLVSFGMPIPSAPTKVAPKVPTALMVSGNALGVNSLRWKPNGNPVRTQYQIQVRGADSMEWTQVGATESSRFDHEDQTPGVFQLYRVRAVRRGIGSVWCEPVAIYGAQLAA